MKRTVATGVIAFSSTLAVILLICGFAAVDVNTRHTGFRRNEPVAGITRQDALHYSGSVLGIEFSLDLEGLNEAVRRGQKLLWFLPPPLRLGIRLIGGA